MARPPAGIHKRRQRGGGGERAVGQQPAGDGRTVGQHDGRAPGRPVRAASDRPCLAGIDQHIDQPGGAQQPGGAVGDIALRDPVERQRHAGPCEADEAGPDPHMPPA